jgi:hypothetical protein
MERDMKRIELGGPNVQIDQPNKESMKDNDAEYTPAVISQDE